MYAVNELGSTCGKCGNEIARSRADSTHDRVLQGDQGFSGLNFIDCLDLVDKYLLEGVNGSAHDLYKDAVVPGGVVRFSDFIQRVQFLQRGGVIFGAFQNNANEAADVVAELLRADINACAGDDRPASFSLREREWSPG